MASDSCNCNHAANCERTNSCHVMLVIRSFARPQAMERQLAFIIRAACVPLLWHDGTQSHVPTMSRA